MSNKKIITLAAIILFSIIGLSIVGCSSPTPTPTSTPKPTLAPTPTATQKSAPASTPTTTVPAKVWKIKFSTTHGPGFWAWEPYELGFKNAVEKASGGRIIIDMYPSNSLVKIDMGFEGLTTGVVDIQFMPTSYRPEFVPLDQAWMLPPLWKSTEQGSQWQKELYSTYFKESRDKLGIHELSFWVSAGYWIFSKSKPINTIGDLKGVKIRAATAMGSKLEQMVGSIPVSVTTSDTYDSLQKGVIDATVGSPAQIASLGWYETGKPGYLINPGAMPSAACGYAIRNAVYDSLPKDLQKILDDAGWEYLALGYNRGEDKLVDEMVQKMKNAGTKVVAWPDAEVLKLREAGAPMWDEFAKTQDAAGRPGSKLVAAIRALAAK